MRQHLVRQYKRCPASATLLLAAWLSSVTAGCDRSPVAPTAPVAPAPAMTMPTPAPPGFWNLTTVLTAVTGPDNCFTQQGQNRLRVPHSIRWQMEVIRSGDHVTFDYDIRNRPIDNLVQTGTVDGREFTARSVSWPQSFPPCADGTILSGTIDANVKGRFSEDGKHLTGQEIWTYHFASGEVLFLFEWSADQE